MFALKFQAGEIALFIPWRGWQPRVRRIRRACGGAIGDGIEGGAPAVSYRDGSSKRPLATSAGGSPLLVFTPAALATSLEHDRPTHAFVAPAHVAALLKAGLLDGHNLDSLRLVVVSGSYCAPELKRKLGDTLAGGRVVEL